MLNRALLVVFLVIGTIGCGDVYYGTTVIIERPAPFAGVHINSPEGEPIDPEPATEPSTPDSPSAPVEPAATYATPATGEAVEQQLGCTVGQPIDIGPGHRAVVAGNDSGYAVAYAANDDGANGPLAFARIFNRAGSQVGDTQGLSADPAQYGLGITVGSSSDRFYPTVGDGAQLSLHEFSPEGELLAVTNVRPLGSNLQVTRGVQPLAIWVTRDERGCASLNRGRVGDGIDDFVRYDTPCEDGMNPIFAASNASAAATLNWHNVGNEGPRVSIVVLGSEGKLVSTILFSSDPHRQYAQLRGLVAVPDGFIATWTIIEAYPTGTDAPAPAPLYMAFVGNDGGIVSVTTLPAADYQSDQHWISNGKDLGVVSRRYPEGNTGEVVFRRFSFGGDLLQETIVATNVGRVYEISATSIAASGGDYAILWHVPASDIVGSRNASIRMALASCHY